MSEREIPGWTLKFLRAICPDQLIEEIEGDLVEQFQDDCHRWGVRKAKLKMVVNTLQHFRPGIILRNKFVFNLFGTLMIQNYFKIAWRHLIKHKLYSVINIAGLMVSFAFCSLIWLYVKEELTFDRSYAHADRIYRAWVIEDYGPDKQFFNTVTPIPLGPALQNNYSEIEATARIDDFTTQVKQDDHTQTEKIHYVDSSFFEIFSPRVLQGQGILRDIQDLVLTQSYALKYFGNQEAVGQFLSIKSGDDFKEYKVAGVVADPPPNVSLQYNMLIPFDNKKLQTSERAWESWFNVSGETYVLLQNQVSGPAVEAKLPSMVKQALGERYKPGVYTVGLQPLTDIHLNTSFPQGLASVSDWKYVYILSGVALLILIVACINFVTLAIGRSLNRAKEVGVRKVVGAERQQLMTQFWTEALLTTLIALILGVLLARLLLPVFNHLADKTLSLELSVGNALFIVCLLLSMGFLAGIYPAFVLSGFSPLLTLRGKTGMGYSRETVRKVMVTFQFLLATMLIIGTLIMKQQLHYLQNKDLGFNREQVVVVPQNMKSRSNEGTDKILAESHQRKQILKNALMRLPAVKEVTTSMFTFGQPGWCEVGFTASDGQYREFNLNVIDPDFVKTYGLQLVAGRNFDEKSMEDVRSGVLVNETFVKAFNLTDPVGSPLPIPFQEYHVIGVIQDFNYQSLHTLVQPVLLVINPTNIYKNMEDINIMGDRTPKISIKLKSKALPQTMAEIQAIWKKVAPDQEFNFSFVDQRLEAQYRQEQRLGTILSITTALGIFIACLGLFGLVTLSMSRKIKEIGIRKILGATVWQVVALSYKEFLGLIFMAFVVAVPVSYLMMNQWLADFAYHIELKLPVFVLAAAIILVIASLTIVYQALKAALVNPADTLKYE